ncbi:MAG: ABC transporter permease [Marivivens sp.]|nr:ABC transporter permease [Marivivens sp.]
MIAAALSSLWSYWRRNPLQLATMIGGLALATALWSGVQALNTEARASYDAAAAVVGEGRYDQLVPRAGETLDEATYLALRRAGWQVSPVLVGSLDLGEVALHLTGVDPLTLPAGAGAAGQVAAVPLAQFLAGEVMLAHPADLAQFGTAQSIDLIASPAITQGMALADIGAAQRLLGQAGAISRLVVAPDQPLGRPPLAEVAPELLLQPAQGGSDTAQLTDSFHLNLTAFGILSFAVGIFIVYGAVGLAFEQRRAMIRALRTMGLSMRFVVVLLGAEIAVISLVSGAIGVVLGYLLAASLLPDVAATLRGLYGAQVAGTLQLHPSWWLSSLGIALLGGILAAASAIWRMSRLPLRAGRDPQVWAMQSARGQRLQLVLGLALLVLSGGFVVAGGSLLAGFARVAALLLGAALLLPPLLEVALHVAQRRARSVTAEWFWADTRQQLPRLGLALMALLLAITANIGVSTMVSSFRLTFIGFLDQRLIAEVYVSAETDAQSAAIEALADDGITVLPLLSVETRIGPQKVDLYGARVAPVYEQYWQFLAQDGDVWSRVAAGEAAIINEQFARRAGLWPGDSIPISPTVTLPIAGVVGDYGNPLGQVIIGEELFITLFPETRARQFGLIGGGADALMARLEAEAGFDPAQMIDQTALKAASLEVFERTFTVTSALNVLTLAVAGAAILMSLLTLASMRVPQLASVWALGVTRHRLGQLELARAVALAVLTLLFALPLGLALAYLLLAVINVEAFGWKLPMYLFPADYARLAVASIGAAALAALVPALRLARTPPARFLQVFANET